MTLEQLLTYGIVFWLGGIVAITMQAFGLLGRNPQGAKTK